MYSSMMQLAASLAQPWSVQQSSDLDVALQFLWQCASDNPGTDLLTILVNNAVGALHRSTVVSQKRRRDPTAVDRMDDSSDDEGVDGRRMRKKATVRDGSGREELRNKADKSAAKPMHDNLLMTKPITSVAGPCTDAVAVSDHLALNNPQLKMALVG